MTYKFEVRLNVGELTPDKVSSRDAGELISSVETMIEEIVVHDNPSIKLTSGLILVSLVGVKEGSSRYELATELEHIVRPAYQKATSAIASGNFDVLPVKSIEAIKNIRKISRRYNAPAEFWEINGISRELAKVSTETNINLQQGGTVEGRTTLYGFLSGVSGENPPRAKIRMLNNEIFDCHVSEKDNLRVARQLGQRLYTEVGVRGTARWEIDNSGVLQLNHFLVEELTEFTPVSIDRALNSLHYIAREDYAQINDIQALISELRGRDEDNE